MAPDSGCFFARRSRRATAATSPRSPSRARGASSRSFCRPPANAFAGLAPGSNPCEHLLVVDPPSQEAIELGLNTAEPATLVVDLNCAFASIEQQHDPALRGRPLAIAAYATDAATIVSSSREARDLGIKTGMRVFEAKAIFPSILVREPDPPLYRSVSDKLIEIMHRHSPDVLRMSIDEVSMNLAGTPGLKKIGPEGVGQSVKGAIRDEVGECLTASVGISTSIWMAKQASNLDKRDGLQRIDHTNLVSVCERLRLSDMVGRRLRAAGRRGRIVSVGVVYRPDEGNFSKQEKQPAPIATGDEIYQAALKLLAARDPRRTVGTLGVGVSGLTDGDAGQLDLFPQAGRPRSERLEAAVDAIRDRFGEDAVQRSRLLGVAQVVRDRIAFGNTGHPDDAPPEKT